MNREKKLLLQSILIVAIILVIDQAIKLWMKMTMEIDQSIYITDWFQLHFAENPGMAFSMELPGNYSKIFLSVFRIIAVFFIGYYIYKLIKSNKSKWLVWCMSLILAGAAGNIIDSMFYGILFSDSYGRVAELLPANGGYAGFLQGNVVDMFYFPLVKGRIPEWSPVMPGDFFVFFNAIFNVADAAITVGAILLFVGVFIFKIDENTTENKSENEIPSVVETPAENQ